MDDFKISFQNRFSELLKSEEILSSLLDEVTKEGAAYVVGGYLRDILLSKPSRDIDFIVDLNDQSFINIVKKLGISYSQNRHGGIKLSLISMSADFWSLENNWAFKNKLVKLNDSDKLNSIAKGCFFNFDSLVLNLNDYSYNLRYFSKCHEENSLDILQKKPVYKNLNPTVEANIIRAVYLKFKYNISYTNNTLKYIIDKLLSLKYRYKDERLRLLEIKQKYSKYDDLENEVFLIMLDGIRKSTPLSNQLHLEFDFLIEDTDLKNNN
jgi:hypothetical protein